MLFSFGDKMLFRIILLEAVILKLSVRTKKKEKEGTQENHGKPKRFESIQVPLLGLCQRLVEP